MATREEIEIIEIGSLPEASSIDGLYTPGIDGNNNSVKVPINLLKGNEGDSPVIGPNGNWWISGVDTGQSAQSSPNNKTVFNVSSYNNKYDYINLAEARSAIPANLRGAGQIITYKLASGEWVTEQYRSTDIDGWSVIDNWINRGDTAIVNPFMVQQIELWKPYSTLEIYIDLSKVVKSVVIDITSDFRKADKTIRRIKIRSVQYATGTSMAAMALDVESVDGIFVSTGVKSSSDGFINYDLDFGKIAIELNINRLNTVSPNTPATFEQGGFNENLVKNAVLNYEYEASLWKDMQLKLSNQYIDLNGSLVSSSSAWNVSQFISVTPGERIKYYGSTVESDGSAKSLFGYDLNGNPVSSILATVSYPNGIIVTIPENIFNIRGGTRSTTPLRILKFGGETKKKIDKNIRWVGMSIWWYDGNTLAGTTEIAKGYQTLLKEQFWFKSDSGTSYCYSGNSLGGLTVGDASSIMTHSSSWTGTEGDIWTLDSITNDFKRNIPIGTISDYNNATGITTFYGALRAFKDKVTSLSGSTATVICSNALRRNNADYTSTSTNTAGHTLVDYEKAMMTIAALNKWYFVDQFRLSGITDDSIFITTIDGLHLNNFGYPLAVLPWISVFNSLFNKLIR